MKKAIGHRRASKSYFPVHRRLWTRYTFRNVISNVRYGRACRKASPKLLLTHELGMKFGTLIETADNLQLYKYAASSCNEGAFLPPLCQSRLPGNGSGILPNQSGQRQAVFAGNQYADLSENALFYIGGIINMLNHLTHLPTRQQTVTSVWFRVMRRPYCWPIHHVTDLHHAVFRMSIPQTASV